MAEDVGGELGGLEVRRTDPCLGLGQKQLTQARSRGKEFLINQE